MNDTNVGLGMVPHRKACGCDECRIERLRHEKKLHMDRCRQDMDRIVALEVENDMLRTTLGATPCRTLMLQETPYSECFPFHNCEPCTCWRALALPTEDTK